MFIQNIGCHIVLSSDLPCVMAQAESGVVQKVEDKIQHAAVSDENEIDELEKKKRVYRQMINSIGLRPWMLTVLANHGIKEAREVNAKVLNKAPSEEKEVTQKKKQHFRQMIRKLGTSRWMLMILIEESTKENSTVLKGSDSEKKPKRRKFRHLVRKLVPGPWMLEVLANNGVLKTEKADTIEFSKPIVGTGMTDEKRKELRTAIRDMGPKPWMLDVVVNQAKAVAKEQESRQEKAKSTEEPNKDRARFRQLVRKLGPASWMLRVLANSGLPVAVETDIATFDKEIAGNEMTEQKHKELREAIKEIGPKPWMVIVVTNQARALAKEQESMKKIGDKTPEIENSQLEDGSDKCIIEITKPNEERTKFRQVVRKLGPGPWMLRVLANNGVPEARHNTTAVFPNQHPDTEMTDEKRKALRRVIKEVGPKPWMVDVIINQTKTLSNTEKMAAEIVADERKLFQQMVIKMGPKSWMFKVLGNNGVPEAMVVNLSEFQFAQQDEEECQMRVKRQTFRRTINNLGPKSWMLNVLMKQCTPSCVKPEENREHSDTAKNGKVVKRREFRQVVRKLKPGSWMIKVLSNNGVQQVTRYPPNVPDDNTNVEEKRGEFRQAIQKIGPKPWMTRVVINQANIFAKVETRKFPPTGNTDAEMTDSEVKEECVKMKKSRKPFAEMVRQMGPKQWMLRVLFNQGLKEAKDVDISGDVGKSTDDENQTRQKRQEFRKYIVNIGPKPWMMKVVINQARRMTEKEKVEEITDDEKAAEIVKTEVRNNRREFSFALKEMRLRPWMLKVLLNHGVAEAEKVDESIFEDRSPYNSTEEQQNRIEFRQMIKKIGPRPWMVRVLRNQAVIAKVEGANVLPGPEPDDLMTQMEKRKKFRCMIEKMGAEPWMFQVLTNQMKKALNQQKVSSLYLFLRRITSLSVLYNMHFIMHLLMIRLSELKISLVYYILFISNNR